MTFAEFFHGYWWLMFPVFGMVMAFWGMASSERRNSRVLDVIKSYIDQGKEPPPELLKLVGEDADYSGGAPQTRQHSGAWTFITFAAMAAGFTTGWWFVRGEDYAFPFLIVAVVMGVLAVGALFILLLGRK
jgi:hypothetical protein